MTTSTVTIHEPSFPPDAGGTVPPSNKNNNAPADVVTVPPQLLTTLSGFATLMPVGKLSVKVEPVRGAALELNKETLRLDTSPGLTVLGEKLLLMPATVTCD